MLNKIKNLSTLVYYIIAFFVLQKSAIAEKCIINLSPAILFTSDRLLSMDFSSLISASNCSPEITSAILERLQDSSGTLRSESLLTDLEEKKVTILPTVIQIQKLKELIDSKIKDHRLSNFTIQENIDKIIMLQKPATMECSTDNNSCKLSIARNTPSFNDNTFHSHSDSDNESSNNTMFHIALTFKQTKNVLIATEDIPALNNDLNISKFIRAEVDAESDPNDNDLEISDQMINRYTNISFIKKGTRLKLDQIILKKMVHIGSTVKATVKAQSINLTISAKALESGVYGQNILIENLQNKKRFTGKVINENEVLITL